MIQPLAAMQFLINYLSNVIENAVSTNVKHNSISLVSQRIVFKI